MLSCHETAYPRLKSSFTTKDLTIYTPTDEEMRFANSIINIPHTKLCFLILLKTFQRLGYFVLLRDVPSAIVNHIARQLGFLIAPMDLSGYDNSGSRRRHIILIRNYLKIKPFDHNAQALINQIMRPVAMTRDDLADLINAAIEGLIEQYYELPGFTTLLRTAQSIRAEVNRDYFFMVSTALTETQRKIVDKLLETNPHTKRSDWNLLKQEPGRPTLSNLRDLVNHLTTLKPYHIAEQAIKLLPDTKLRQFAAEARSLDAARMASLSIHKRYSLAVVFIHSLVTCALDDLTEMFIKRMHKIHHSGDQALIEYRQKHQGITDELVATFAEVLLALQHEGSVQQRLALIEQSVGAETDKLLQQCTAYLAHSKNNYYPLLWKYYAGYRTVLFSLIEHLMPISTSQDRSMEEVIKFLFAHRATKGDFIRVLELDRDSQGRKKLVAKVDLSWIPDKWWRLVTGLQTREKLPHSVNRRYFEMCVFSQLMWELKSADLCINGSDKFSDYREQFISWEEYQKALPTYCQQLGLPTEAEDFCQYLKQWLDNIAKQTDASFPTNESVQIINGEPILKRLKSRPHSKQWKELEKLIAKHMPSINILDALADTENWLNWTRFFRPLSGYDGKIDRPRERYVVTSFAYGSYLGPSQTAKAIKIFDRRQLYWINQRHITQDNLYAATVEIINAYNQFLLPKLWGSGKHVSADGMKWNMYEQNLLAEYHIRYGGYGGIGYYHVSDTYIALFSHFIPCGVWEAVYILDGILNNTSDIQPDVIHSDTQGQSSPVFGLAYLLGIKLMPRIRNWKDLKLYKPQRNSHYPHTDALYADVIDWDLIKTHFHDMLRLVLSIQAGRVSASTVLRKLGTYSRKNKLYQAFRELGRVVRTAFLLHYLSDKELRYTIQSATNKSEAFNKFIQWVAFGGNGLIAENTRDEQRKIIKYSHLIANCLILHNVYTLTSVLQQLIMQGYKIDNETMARLSPYLTEHINRFGDYSLNLDRQPPPLNDGLKSFF